MTFAYTRCMHDRVLHSRFLIRPMLSVNMDERFQLQTRFTQLSQDITLTPTLVTDQELLGIPIDSFKLEFDQNESTDLPETLYSKGDQKKL